jgi:hypothetical protein
VEITAMGSVMVDERIGDLDTVMAVLRMGDYIE